MSILVTDYSIEVFNSIVQKIEIILGCRSRIEILFYLGWREYILFTSRLVTQLNLDSLTYFFYFDYTFTIGKRYFPVYFVLGFHPDEIHFNWLTQAHPWLNKVFPGNWYRHHLLLFLEQEQASNKQ